MIPFNEISQRLKSLGKDRAWLAEKSGRSIDSIRTALAPSASSAKRSELLQKALSDAIERAESVTAPSVIPPDHIVLAPSVSEYRAWSLAHKASDAPTLKDWAIDELNKAAAAWIASSKKPAKAIDPIEALPTEETHWLKVYGGIAAGSPISSDVSSDKIKVAQEYPSDCYALTVHGRSMETRIPDGSTIVVKRLKEGTHPKQGSIVVYSDGHGLSLKKLAYRKAKEGEEANNLGKVAVLESLNPEFPEVQTMDGGRIEAVFVELLTPQNIVPAIAAMQDAPVEKQA